LVANPLPILGIVPVFEVERGQEIEVGKMGILILENCIFQNRCSETSGGLPVHMNTWPV
jgi:hypothetical protein